MRFVHRVAVVIYIVSIGWFALLWLPSLLGTGGPPPWPWGRYLAAIIECQIPATILVGLVYLVAWCAYARSARVRRWAGCKFHVSD